MGTWLAAPWQIALSAAIPVILAVLLFLIEQRGPLAAPIQSTTGLVGPYFGAVSIVFGLFAALLASDAWQKDNAVRYTVKAEADAVHVTAQLARAAGLEAAVVPKLKAYARAASAEDPYSEAIDLRRSKTDEVYQALLATLMQAPGLDGSVRTALLGSARDLLQAHDDRLYLANDRTALIKWISMIVFGAITQVALLLVHVGNLRAQRVAVGLFTVAFSFCLMVVAIFDSPFETLLANEPSASLGVVLKGL